MFQYFDLRQVLTHSRHQKLISKLLKSNIESHVIPTRFNKNFSLTQQLAMKLGGARRDRTADLLRARQALSQLSYGPQKWWVWEDSNFRPHPYQGCALTN